MTPANIRRHRPDYRIILLAGILMLLGLVVLYAISPARVELINVAGNDLDHTHFMQKQFAYLAVGIVGFIIAATVPITFWQKYATKILGAGLLACILLFLLGTVMDGGLVLKSGGATRWFNVGFGTFQPAELVKFGLLLFTSVFLASRIRDRKVNSLHETLIPLGVILGIAAIFIVGIQKDMGTGITMGGIVASMLFLAGLKARYILVGGLAALGIGLLFIVTSPHRMERVNTFLSGAHDASDASHWHILQATIALGSGGLTGKGLGQSIQAFGYLPEAVNDSIFAILGETFGFIGVLAILGLFFGLLLRLLKIMDHLADPLHRMIVAGVFGLIATHAIVNIGAMLGVFPLTGVTLPFLSFGGTSLLFTMLALGLAFQVSRYTSHHTIKEMEGSGGKGNALTRGRRGVGRTRYAGSRGYQRA
jgi:cell division protein FtsW